MWFVYNYPSFTNYTIRIQGKTFQSLLIREMRLTKSNSEFSHSLQIKALNNQPRWSCKTQDMTHQVVCACFFLFVFFNSVATVHNPKPYLQQLPELGRVASRELSLALVEQINLLVLYAVLFPYQPNPHRELKNWQHKDTVSCQIQQAGHSQLFMTP